MIEFTGERVIPGQVDPDLWNEHYSRYLFAFRLARFRRVLDVGCGAGYGSALLAQSARRVFALDASPDALSLAAHALAGSENSETLAASATHLPFAPNSLDLVVAFEVIEHLAEWPELIREARRVLAPGGQFIVSTPNREYYAAQRGNSGPNPFHTHEFSFTEFRDALKEVFPHVLLFVQNHAAGVVFRPLEDAASSDVKLEGGTVDPETAHFFVAVCAASPQTGAPNFVYLPASANVLKEREDHIGHLEGEVATKDQWLAQSQTEHVELLDRFRLQQAKLEESNLWTEKVAAEAKVAQERNAQIQAELEAEQQRASQVVSAYEQRMRELEREHQEAVRWAQDTETRLTADMTRLHEALEVRNREIEAKAKELVECVQLLDKAEQVLIERTVWAQGIERRANEIEAQLGAVQASRWVKLGKSFGLGPRFGANSAE